MQNSVGTRLPQSRSQHLDLRWPWPGWRWSTPRRAVPGHATAPTEVQCQVTPRIQLTNTVKSQHMLAALIIVHNVCIWLAPNQKSIHRRKFSVYLSDRKFVRVTVYGPAQIGTVRQMEVNQDESELTKRPWTFVLVFEYCLLKVDVRCIFQRSVFEINELKARRPGRRN